MNEPKSVDEVLRNVSVAGHVLEEFRPLAESLPWRLSDRVWSTAGVTPFVEDEVPFIVTSNGRLSEDAAAVLLANCLESPPDGPIVVLELGAGSGLFARYFVDAFRALATQADSDLSDRLAYLVSDRSPRTVQQWVERGVFENHENQIIPGVCDALSPQCFQPHGAARTPDVPYRAVICNYALDALPANLVRPGVAGYEELAIRTSLPDDADLLASYTQRSPAELRDLAASDDPFALDALIPLVSLLRLEAAFIPASPPGMIDSEEALSIVPGPSRRAVVNRGAVACVEASLALVSSDGFVLVSDYGPVRTEQVADQARVQRFGRTTALGINFLFLDHHLTGAGYQVLRPAGDEEWPIHSRLFARRELPRTGEAFHSRFAFSAFTARERPVEEARNLRVAGRNDQALEAYRAALAQRPRDWHLLGEVAEFVGVQLRDFAAGAEVARAALALNPCYSTLLWNVLGDCLFCQQRYEDAYEAYRQAQRVDPRDARTNVNLAYSLFQSGAYNEALNAIAVGFATDVKGQFHENLVQKQQQVVSAIRARAVSEAERMTRAIPIPA
jgi:tetratricopeptide (TPR) repeat protein